MIYTTEELIKNNETQYSIKNRLINKTLFLIERGIYSDEENPLLNECYISKKYPHAIITDLSAFYIYDLTDHIPTNFYLATIQHSFPIRRDDVVQSYQDPSFFSIGVTTIKYEKGVINIYDLERMLIELIRLKEKYPPELYYEVVNSFRKIKNKLDFYKINEYAKHFKNGKNLLQKIKEII